MSKQRMQLKERQCHSHHTAVCPSIRPSIFLTLSTLHTHTFLLVVSFETLSFAFMTIFQSTIYDYSFDFQTTPVICFTLSDLVSSMGQTQL